VEKQMVNWENSVADSLFFGKSICQLFYQKCFFLGENFTALQLSF
jgi:hypothetical protein